MTARSIRLSFLALLLAATASAQPLQPGMIVALRGKSGAFLSASANPVQALGMSPHAAGWEQWQYRSEGGDTERLVSFHGTALMISPDAVPFHGPVDDSEDRGFHVGGVEDRTNFAGVKYGVGAGAIINGRVTISRTRGDGHVALLSDTGHGVAGQWQTSSNISGSANHPLVVPVSYASEWWTIVPITAPDTNRATRLQESISNGGYYNVQSAHGTFLNVGDYSGVQLDTWRSVHSPAKRSIRVEYANDRDQARAITYGLPFDILMMTMDKRGPCYLAPTTRTGGQFNLPLVVVYPGMGRNSTWMLVDPTGRYRSGDRVPLGARVALRNIGIGKNLSSDPSLDHLVASPNVAAWEQWTFAHTQ
ncbi:MAG: hypothetical protein M3P29_11345 [Acidobacteriota bacterium]|nr:hypothetical protein [Acidobacteriota bacterium]